MKKFRIIPFDWLPASWGLSGPIYDEQKARYYYDGYDLEEQLAYINLTGIELDTCLLNLRKEYGYINESEYDLAHAELLDCAVEREIAIIEARHKAGELTAVEAEKAIATANKEPWIKVVHDGIDHSMGVDGYFFEFDWNDLWVKALVEAGYTGSTDEAIVQAWFQDVCRNEAGGIINL